MTIQWPRELLPPQQPMFHIAPMNISGPVSASGAADVISGDAGFWRASYGSVVVTTRERVLTWRAISAKLRGRLYPILVPYCGMYQPYPLDANGKRIFTKPGIPHSDGALFSDESGYLSGVISAILVGSLPVRAVNGNITVNAADAIQPGHVFSFGERMYEILDVTYTSETTATLTWQPPLREAVTAGTELNFDRPVCRMRLASDSEMQLQLDMNKRSFPTVNFVEDLVS
ncbi:hypothetical protein [Ensifer aridi]|uniref:hypothetical protein n=1 Tax=Ensifer aridi TaxID=1708715 RepID=UPI000A11A080|nr:hypothetical protein [Ensifer aridi]